MWHEVSEYLYEKWEENILLQPVRTDGEHLKEITKNSLRIITKSVEKKIF